MAEAGRTFVALQGRGLLALPADVRRRHRLDRPGAQVEIVERDDGVIELHAHLPVRADQEWFWSERWQQREAEAEADIAADRVTTHESADAFVAHLESLEDDS